MASPLLEARDVRVAYGQKVAVDEVSFALASGERLGLVGESGSGKTSLASTVLRTLPDAASVSGRVALGDVDLLSLPARELRTVLGARIARVPQDPLGSLNPVLTIGYQLRDVLAAHRRLSKAERTRIALEALQQVGIGDAATKLRSYPHELSGGMRQRVMIAMALLNQPDLLIADEPTTALDVTVQAQVVDLLRTRVRESGMALLLISHDIGVVSELCDRVLVMLEGRIVEEGPVTEVLAHPTHNYTRELLSAVKGELADG